MLRLTAVVLLLLVLPARANLGDTVADCVKRYGKPQSFTEPNAGTPFGTLSFIAGPYVMIVFLYNTVEVGARVSKKDKSAFTPEEMKTIMAADAPTPWVLTPSSDPTSLEWTRADKASVTYDTAAKMLIFTTPDMVKDLHNFSGPSTESIYATNAAPARPQGNFAPAAPTPWNVAPPATNAAPAAP